MKIPIYRDEVIGALEVAKSHLTCSNYWWSLYQDSNETDSAALSYFREAELVSRAMLQTVEMLTGIYVPNNITSIDEVISAIKNSEEIPQYV